MRSGEDTCQSEARLQVKYIYRNLRSPFPCPTFGFHNCKFVVIPVRAFHFASMEPWSPVHFRLAVPGGRGAAGSHADVVANIHGARGAWEPRVFVESMNLSKFFQDL